MTSQEMNINPEINAADAYLQLSISPPQEIFSGTGDYFRRNPTKYHQNPRKKRTKLLRIENPIGFNSSSSPSTTNGFRIENPIPLNSSSTSTTYNGFRIENPIALNSSSTTTTSGYAVKKPKYGGKKPDPSAPKITRPCSECGKKFWSWKALFGHMRCHPERQWRGINPPPKFRRPVNDDGVMVETEWTEEDLEVAACLLMLANSPSPFEEKGLNVIKISGINRGFLDSENNAGVRDVVAQGLGGGGNVESGFECSSCKKVFGSHQALGGHRATHKNVKGCFAITRSDCEEVVVIEDHNNVDAQHVDCSGSGELAGEGIMVLGGHKCSICSRVFATGQALGGHKRCHWEKGDDHDHEPSLSLVTQGGFNFNPFGGERQSRGLDLNLPAPVEYDSSSSLPLSLSYSSSGLALDLRLGL